METTSAKINGEQITGTKNELQNLGSGLQSQAGIEVKRKDMLVRHIHDLNETNSRWLDRLMLNSDSKNLLKLYGEKQLEAAEMVLDEQNKTLSVLCDAQLAFVKEVVNTLLTTGRSGLQGAAAAIFRENAMALHSKLARLSFEFANLVEGKLKDAETRAPIVQEMLMEEISIMVQKWRFDYQHILEDFGKILDEKL